MPFAEMVDLYLPVYDKLRSDNVVKAMFRKGLYGDAVKSHKKLFSDRLVIIDGGVFKEKPWTSLMKIEKALFPERIKRFFTKERFKKRDDGYYCLIVDLVWLKIYLTYKQDAFSTNNKRKNPQNQTSSAYQSQRAVRVESK